MPIRTWLLHADHRLAPIWRSVTAWLVHHKLMAAMAECDAREPLAGDVQLDDAYLGGEHPGVGGRGSPNKVPIVAAVSTNDAGRPMRVKVTAIGSFTREAIANWAMSPTAVMEPPMFGILEPQTGG